jgi:hypothetical protein
VESLLAFVFVTALVLLAALAQTVTGFGFALLFVPLATLAVGAKASVASALLLSVVASGAPWLEIRPRPPLRPVLPIAGAALASTPLGILVLAGADEALLRFVVGFAVLAGAVTVLRRAPSSGNAVAPARRRRLLPLFGVGLLSGVARGATSMGGPPLVLYLHWSGAAPEAARITLLSYLGVMSVSSVPFVLLSGEVTAEVLRIVAAGIPAVLVALVIGRRVRRLVTESRYRRISVALLTISGSAALGAAIAGLI